MFVNGYHLFKKKLPVELISVFYVDIRVSETKEVHFKSRVLEH